MKKYYMTIGPITKEISKERAEQILRLQRIIKEQSKNKNNNNNNNNNVELKKYE